MPRAPIKANKRDSYERTREMYEKFHKLRCEFDELLSNWEPNWSGGPDRFSVTFLRYINALSRANRLLTLGEIELKTICSDAILSTVHVDQPSTIEDNLDYEEEVIASGDQRYLHQTIDCGKLLAAQVSLESNPYLLGSE